MSPLSRSRSRSARHSHSHSPYRRIGRRRPSRPPNGYSSERSTRSRSVSLSYEEHFSRRHYTRSRSNSNSRSRSRSHNSYRRSDRNREKPLPSRCIGVFGLNIYTTQPQIREIFGKFGTIERIQVVIDAQTGRSRGFCFIYYKELSDAKAACDNCCGMEIDGRRIRVDYSVTERPHTPTPGSYKGLPAKNFRERHRGEKNKRHHQSPINYRRGYRHRSERSRSRSFSGAYTPRRYRN